MWKIDYTDEAVAQLKKFRAYDRAMIYNEIESQLPYDADVKVRNRHPVENDPEDRWELRLGDFRVFCRIEREEIVVLVVAVVEKGRKMIVDVLKERKSNRYPKWFFDYLDDVERNSRRISSVAARKILFPRGRR